jgi:DNA topoisomerase I
MFRPEWRRNSRNQWFHLDPRTGKNLGQQKPPLDKWKQEGLRFPPGYDEVLVNIHHKKTPIRFIDTEGRTQYQYWPHTLQKHRRKHWGHLHELGPLFYHKVEPLLVKHKYPTNGDWEKEDVVRLMIWCSLECGIRPGYPKYRDKHQSFGLTTMEKRHVKVAPSWGNPIEVKFRFPGKKQVLNECNACSRETDSANDKIWKTALKNYVKWRATQSPKSPSSVFWLNPETHELIHPEVLNEWIQNNIHEEMTMKDLRTWLVHTHLLKRLAEIPKDTPMNTKKAILGAWREAIQDVAEETHHTPAVCQSSYLHPQVKKDWLEQKIKNYQTLSPKKYLLAIWKKKIE